MMTIATKKEKLIDKMAKIDLKISEHQEKIKVLEEEKLKYKKELKKQEEQEILNLIERKNIDISQLETLLNELNNPNINNEIINNSDERRYGFE